MLRMETDGYFREFLSFAQMYGINLPRFTKKNLGKYSLIQLTYIQYI